MATRRAAVAILATAALTSTAALVSTAALTNNAALTSTAAAAQEPGWHNVPGPAPLRAGALNQIDVATSTTAFAVGIEGIQQSGHIPNTAIFRWDGRRWSRQATPVPFAPTDVAALGPRRAWAVGINALGPVAVHWNGARWIRSRFPVRAGIPNAVTAVPDGSAWSVAQNVSRRTSTVLRWASGTWHPMRVPLPPKTALTTVAARTRNDVWLGGTADHRALIMRWDGIRWRRVPLPPGGETGISRILPLRPDHVWALRGPHASALLHWNGRGWTQYPLPGGIAALSLAEDGRGGAWLVPVTDSKATRTYYLHWDGRSWRKLYGPGRRGNAQLGDIDRVPGGTTMFGVGAIQQRGRRIPLIERYG